MLLSLSSYFAGDDLIVQETDQEVDEADSDQDEESEAPDTPIVKHKSKKSTSYCSPNSPVKQRTSKKPHLNSAKRTKKTQRSSSKKPTNKALDDCSNRDNRRLQEAYLESDDDSSMAPGKKASARKSSDPERSSPRISKQTEKKIQDQEDELAKLKAQLAEKDKELKRRDQLQLANPTKKKSRRDSKNDEMVLQIKDYIRKEGWRRSKFSTSDAQTNTMMEAFLDDRGMFADENDRTRRMRAQFLEDYRKDYDVQLNDCRQYVQSRMREVALEWQAKYGDDSLPLHGTIYACINRTLDLKDPAKAKIAKWWWDDLLPRATANAACWGDNMRHHETISRATLQIVDWDNPPAKISFHVPPSTEAICGVIYDSCRTRWTNQFKWNKAHPGFGMLLVWKQGRSDDEIKRIEAVTQDTLSKKPVKTPKKKKPVVKVFNEPDFAPKYTQPVVGNKPHSGWKEEGIKLFRKMADSNREIRGTELSNAWEEKVLDLVRADYDEEYLRETDEQDDEEAGEQNAVQALDEIELQMED